MGKERTFKCCWLFWLNLWMSVRQSSYKGLFDFRPETWHLAKLGAVEATMCCPCQRRDPSTSFCVSAFVFSQLFIWLFFGVPTLPFCMNSLSLSAALSFATQQHITHHEATQDPRWKGQCFNPAVSLLQQIVTTIHQHTCTPRTKPRVSASK